MTKLLLSAFLVLSLSACDVFGTKAEVFTWNTMEFSLTQEVCKDAEILALAKQINLRDELYASFFTGKVTEDKVDTKMCWVANPDDPSNVFVIDEKGNMGVVERPVKK